MISIVAFIVLLFFIIKSKNNYSLLLLFSFPTILVINRNCSAYGNVESIITMPFLVTFLDFMIELFSGHWGKSFDAFSSWYYSSNFVVEVYSILLAILFYFMLNKKNYVEIKNDIILFFNNLYFNLFLGLIFIISIFYFLHNDKMECSSILKFSKQNNISLVLYVISYFTLLMLFFKTRKYLTKDTNQLICLIFISFFPFISVTNEYRQISICSNEGIVFERIISISPFFRAIPNTILSFQDYKKDFFELFISLKMFTLFQSILILLFFPSLLLSKSEENAK